MGIVRHAGTIGGFTAISRVLGFARDMLLARLLGAGLAADAFQLAFVIPNTFRRLFAEGALSAAFVPFYTRIRHHGGEEAATRFASNILAVFCCTVLAMTAVALLVMPGVVWLLAHEFADVPGKFELSVSLSRITFPYLGLVSLVALLAGVLNARSRFAPGAFVPVLLNIVLLTGIGAGFWLRHQGVSDGVIVTVLAWSVPVGGAIQLLYLGWAVNRRGKLIGITAPRPDPEARRLGRMIVPAMLGGGVYHIGQLIDTFFAASLQQGSLTLLRYTDRIIQLPAGIIGIAFGTAILPALARHVQARDDSQVHALQSRATELAMLLTLPAAAALWLCSGPIVTALFVGGRMGLADGLAMAAILKAMAAGLPAYVMIKVLQPAFFAREDAKTPMMIAALSLAVNVAVNLVVVSRFGIVGLAGASAFAAMLNMIILAWAAYRRGWFRLGTGFAGTLARQIVATAILGVFLWWLSPMMALYYGGSAIDRVWSIGVLVGSGLGVFVLAAVVTGAIDKAMLCQLRALRHGHGAPMEP